MDHDSQEFLKKHGHSQIKICVSGAAETGHCGLNALDKAKELGREIARQGAVLVTGATTGFPLWVGRLSLSLLHRCVGAPLAAQSGAYAHCLALATFPGVGTGPCWNAGTEPYLAAQPGMDPG